MNKITIDLKEIAEKMIEMGIEPSSIYAGEYGGWSYAILDSMESIYGIEGKLTKIITDRHLGDIQWNSLEN